MKLRLFCGLLALSLLLGGCGDAPAPSSTASTPSQQSQPSFTSSATTQPTQAPQVDLHEAVYLGVENYGSLSQEDKDDFTHLFFRDGRIIRLKLRPDNSYSLQNQLMEGYFYLLETENGLLTAVTEVTPTATVLSQVQSVYAVTTAPGGAAVTAVTLDAGQAVWSLGTNLYTYAPGKTYVPPVSGRPGLKTLKNLLATAMMPVGTTLYVYGGGWNWQDSGASPQATTIGLPESWTRFFDSQDSSYHYRNGEPQASFFPTGGWNQYYYAGADCSGYLGWTLYNTLHTHSGDEGYVISSTKMAADFAARGWGRLVTGQMLPGDILSMSGHVYLSLGTCPDGSVVILHSTPNTTGGAGVQLSAIGENKNCQAYALAKSYMQRFYPAWAERYGDQVLCLSPAAYAPTAHFRWSLPGTLTDPDGFAAMTPAQVLENLFGT